MFKIKGQSVSITRGDSAKITVDLKDEMTKETYTLKPEDELVFTVKKDYRDNAPVFQLESDGNGMFTILPSTTSALDFGRYDYDVQLTTSEGDVYTVIVSDFTITEEVTWSAPADDSSE